MKEKIYSGITPAVILENPKYPHNVGAAIRAASCFGIKQIWYSGNRMDAALMETYRKRLPREERMKGYKEVELIGYDYPFDVFKNAVPVAVEIRKDFISLPDFNHPENAVYVFGPEDGSISKVFLKHCHHFVVIPSYHCLNLAAAVYTVLYDRTVKTGPPFPSLREERGYWIDLEKEK
jgi:tRNA(Leu) C34 or U34 (ribose-2'-O)-methylase TrmL